MSTESVFIGVPLTVLDGTGCERIVLKPEILSTRAIWPGAGRHPARGHVIAADLAFHHVLDAAARRAGVALDGALQGPALGGQAADEAESVPDRGDDRDQDDEFLQAGPEHPCHLAAAVPSGQAKRPATHRSGPQERALRETKVPPPPNRPLRSPAAIGGPASLVGRRFQASAPSRRIWHARSAGHLRCWPPAPLFPPRAPAHAPR